MSSTLEQEIFYLQKLDLDTDFVQGRLDGLVAILTEKYADNREVVTEILLKNHRAFWNCDFLVGKMSAFFEFCPNDLLYKDIYRS